MICPYCRGGLDEGEAACVCRGCRTAVHPECAALNGRCTTFGCSGTAFDAAAAPPASARLARPQAPVAPRRRWRASSRRGSLARAAAHLLARDEGLLAALAGLGTIGLLSAALR